MKLDGYIRVSRVAGRSGDSFISPDVQRQQIAEYARYHDHEVVAWHEDLDQSGGTINRPGFLAMLARIDSGVTDGVIVPKLDRFGRSVPRIYEALERIEGAGGVLISVSENLDLSTASGKANFTMLGMMAQFQRDQATEAWDVSNRRAIERGIHFTNRPPYGYLRGEDRRLVPDPATAWVVREVFERRGRKESRTRIAAWLNEVQPREGGRDWTSRNVAALVQSRAYLGEAFHGPHRNPAAHEPIVSPQEWETANAVKGTTSPQHRTAALLAGIVRCAGCRYALRRTFATYSDGRKVQTYSCQVTHTGGKCPAPAMIRADALERHVIDHIRTMFGTMTWAEEDADTTELDAERRVHASAEARLADLLADDELREVAGRDVFLAEVRSRRSAVEASEATVERLKAQHSSDTRRQLVLAGEWARWTAEGDEAMRADFLRMVLETVYVRKGRGNVDRRVIIRWDGEDRFERPRRGSTRYVSKPIPWPGEGEHDAYLASIPEWAWRIGHVAIPENVRATVHELARERGATHFLPEAGAA
jgi:DNA invertase Pin-like site-specific DNA recombinase